MFVMCRSLYIRRSLVQEYALIGVTIYNLMGCFQAILQTLYIVLIVYVKFACPKLELPWQKGVRQSNVRAFARTVAEQYGNGKISKVC